MSDNDRMKDEGLRNFFTLQTHPRFISAVDFILHPLHFRLQMICELCERNLERLTVHHLIPRQKTKRKKIDPGPTITICSACHKQIHSLFDNTHLAKELNSLEKLKNEPQMQKFLAWVKKQDPHKRVQVHRPKAS